MLVCVVMKNKRQISNLQTTNDIDKSRVCELFFRAGEDLGMKTHSPLTSLRLVLENHFPLVLELVNEKRDFPPDFSPYINCVNIILDKLEELDKLETEDGRVVLQPSFNQPSTSSFDGF